MLLSYEMKAPCLTTQLATEKIIITSVYFLCDFECNFSKIFFGWKTKTNELKTTTLLADERTKMWCNVTEPSGGSVTVSVMQRLDFKYFRSPGSHYPGTAVIKGKILTTFQHNFSLTADSYCPESPLACPEIQSTGSSPLRPRVVQNLHWAFGRETKSKQALLQIGSLHKEPGFSQKSAPFVTVDLIKAAEQNGAYCFVERCL